MTVAGALSFLGKRGCKSDQRIRNGTHRLQTLVKFACETILSAFQEISSLGVVVKLK